MNRRINTFLIMLFTASLSLLSSCSKEADASLIKVSSTPLDGSASGGSTGEGTSNGSSASTIQFKINDRNYTITNGTDGSVNCSGTPAIPGISAATTSLQAANQAQSLTFSLYSNNISAGTFNLDQFSITTPDGTLYTPTDQAKVTYTTYTIKATYLVASKGSFNIPANYGSLSNQQTTTITGSFDIK